jgi:autotransporter-associated beta strand protein
MAVNGGTLDLGSYSQTLAAVSVGTSGGSITGTTGVLTGSSFTFNNTTGNAATVTAILAGTGTLTQAGTGTTTLSGANTYTGATTISAGLLKLGAAGGATNTPLGTTGAGTTVASGAALDLNGYTLGSAEALTLNGTGVSSGGALMNSGAAVVPPHLLHPRPASPLLVRLGFLVREAVNQLAVGDHERTHERRRHVSRAEVLGRLLPIVRWRHVGG